MKFHIFKITLSNKQNPSQKCLFASTKRNIFPSNPRSVLSYNPLGYILVCFWDCPSHIFSTPVSVLLLVLRIQLSLLFLGNGPVLNDTENDVSQWI